MTRFSVSFLARIFLHPVTLSLSFLAYQFLEQGVPPVNHHQPLKFQIRKTPSATGWHYNEYRLLPPIDQITTGISIKDKIPPTNDNVA